GFAPGSARDLRQALPNVPRWKRLGSAGRTRVRREFMSIAGVEDVVVVDAGNALLLVGGPSAPVRRVLSVVGSMLSDMLRHLQTVSVAKRRNARLQLGIASTAHELAQPVRSAAMVLDLLIENGRD